MSRQINQPINQVRLTNVAVVRMNRGGKRFEIACYRNKVVDYRQGLETDLSEVLQTERVFTNVSKGEFAKAKDLQKIFGISDEEQIARMILSKGQVQVSDKERNQQLEKTNAQIAEWISKNCVQPSTDRPYTISQIRHAMQQANFSVHPTKPLKRQFLDCLKLLQDIIPIQRAKMELLLLIPDTDSSSSAIEAAMSEHQIEWELEVKEKSDGEKVTTNREYKLSVDPSLYRVLNEVVLEMPGAYIEIITQVVTGQGDIHIETELEHLPTVLDDASIINTTIGTSPTESRDLDQFHEAIDQEENEEKLASNHRQQQKKNKKKNQKNQRRGDFECIELSAANTAPLSTIISSSIPKVAGSSGDADPRKTCNTCGGSFENPASYRAHFKSDWHRFNQKLKLKGAASISEEEFKLCDSDSFFGGIGKDNIL